MKVKTQQQQQQQQRNDGSKAVAYLLACLAILIAIIAFASFRMNGSL